MTFDDEGFSDEERRLREYIESGGRHPGEVDAEGERLDWPEHLVLSYPHIFPRRRKPEPKVGPGTRRLLWVAVPVILVLIWAEATDSLIGDAWLLALIAAVAALAFWVGFLAPPMARADGAAGVLVLGFDFYYRTYAQRDSSYSSASSGSRRISECVNTAPSETSSPS
jgi:hypothetical protein